MTIARKCLRCSADLSPIELDGLCPACLLKGGLFLDEPGADATATSDVPPTAPSLRSDMPLPQIDGFRLIEPIGIGGMGVVYKAEQREPIQRLVAIKLIKVGMDTEELIARFESERQALA